MKFSMRLAAVVAFLPSALAHVSMDFPKSFAGGADNVEPLDPSGSNYPCMAPNYDSLSSQLTIQPGESGEIVLSKLNPNAAPHGGGSCQISLTYDKAPTASTRFTVIKSIMGGCPVVSEGNNAKGPYTLSYTIPQDAPAGEAILAWTWFNKIGNREMYMRCAPITIGGSNSDVTTFSQTRPDIFKANIGNGCKTQDNSDVIFPNPGSDVVGQGSAGPDPASNCASGSSPVAPPKPSSSVTKPAEPSATATPTEPSATATPAPIRPGNGNGPVIKLPVESPVEKPATPVETETPEAPVETEAPEVEEPVEDEKPVVAKPISPPANGTPGTPVAAPSTPPSKDAIPCDKPGSIVCTSDNTFALCNHGFLVNMGRTAMGTSCSQGKITKRAYPIRLTGHIRRRHGKF